MCGIGGFYGEGDSAALERMADVLSHRGPDDRGAWKKGNVGFAHTRLSIIDLSSAGHQPMESSTGKTTIVFNGEIYNYRELKKELASTYTFRSESDTEVILALYEKEGTKAFEALHGMFAFALYDHSTKELFLVRDRMGKKPLYWGVFDGTLIFGSELKALIQHPKFKKEIDPHALQMYLTFECVPTPYSIFKNVRKVHAGGYVVFAPGKESREELYWTLPRKRLDIPFSQALTLLDEKLSHAVEARLVSDVPLGVFLSGGIDSSTIAYYAQKASSTRVQTFSIGFTDKGFDESVHAQEVARSLGSAHTMEYFSPSRCIELVDEVFGHLDEPLADASILPTHLLSSFTKKHVSTALGGDGADELFAGYPTFRAERLLGAYTMLPRVMRKNMIEPLIRALPVRHAYFSLDFVAKKFLEGAYAPAHYRHQHWLGAFSDEESRAAVLPDVQLQWNTSAHAHLDQFFEDDAPREDFLNNVLWSYLRTYCMDEVLVKLDRASMAHGLEVRAPFLDHELVEFVMNLPYHYKFQGLSGKYILTRLMKGKLPASILRRRKQGFAIPLGKWLRNEMRPLSRELLSKSALEKSGCFNHTKVAQLLAEHEAGAKDHRKKLWTLMAFQLWFNTWAR